MVVSVSKQLQFQCPPSLVAFLKVKFFFLQVPTGSVRGDVMAVLYIDVEYVKKGSGQRYGALEYLIKYALSKGSFNFLE